MGKQVGNLNDRLSAAIGRAAKLAEIDVRKAPVTVAKAPAGSATKLFDAASIGAISGGQANMASYDQ